MAFELMAPLMFAMLAALLLLGYPVAFALAANGMLFAFVGFELGMLQPEILQALPQRLFGIMSNQLLIAIPFFTFMGIVLERTGMAEDLLDSIGQIFGPVRGGVAYAVILVGALLAATTGVIAASVIAMGLISLPVMLRYGYDPRVASGVICASGTLAQIIPPSIVLIVLADVLGASVGDLYAGALVPGLLLVGLLVASVLVVSIVKPAAVPALPPQARTLRGAALLRRALASMVPPLVLIFLVLGTIFLGIATPSEGGAMGAVGAIALALAKRRLTWVLLRQAMDQTAKLTTFVMFILVGSTVFALVFRAVEGDLWVERLFDLVPGGAVGFLLVVNLIVFVLGFFIDFFEIAFILLPLLAPVAAKLGIDPVWFAVMIGLNMQTSFLTPPFGFALFYLRSVAPKSIATADIYRGVVPFVGVQLLAVGLLFAFPGMTELLAPERGKKVDPDKVEIRLEAPAEDRGADDRAAEDLQKALGAPAPKEGPPAKGGPAPAPGAAPKSEEEMAAEELERQLKGLK